jgi:NAD(P)H-nitrite reductase large subunit
VEIKTKYLIIGSSIAAINAVDAIRSHDPDGECTILTCEKEPFHSKPMLEHLVAGELREEEILLRSEDFFSRLNLQVLADCCVLSIDADKMVARADGDLDVFFEKALISTGSNPRKLDLDGMDADGVSYFHSMEDARQVADLLGNVESAVIIGAGLIGVRAAYALEKNGIKVILFEMMDRIMPNIMDRTGSEILIDAMQAVGSRVELNSSVQRIEVGNGRVTGVISDSGRSFPCQLVLVAAGVEPNVEFTSGSGIEVNRGVIVDRYLRTNKPGIYAAGDVVEFSDLITGDFTVNANWVNAAIQGGIAGNNMAGQKKIYEGSIGMNSIECGGVPSITMGMVNPIGDNYDVRSRVNLDNRLYRKLVFLDGRVVGAIMIGQIRDAGLVLRLINEKIDVKGLEDDILNESGRFFDLVRNLNREEMEGDLDWPESLSMQERYEKKFDEDKLSERERGGR